MATRESFLQYLPSVLQHSATELPPGEKAFIESFLQIFEEQFTKLESKVDRIPHLFDPWKVEARFLSWLASWLALETLIASGKFTQLLWTESTVTAK